MTAQVRAPGMLRKSALAVAVVATFAMTMPADAQSNYCDRLQADYLAAVQSSGGGSSNIRSLRGQLAAAESEAQAKNCRRFLFFGNRPARDCPAVMTRLNRLRNQVSQATGGGWGFTRQTSFQRDRLYNQLRQNGCQIPSLGDTAGSGYRTLCVRTCDGYYFPISFSASRSRFKIDETVCKAMYGGADAELFVYANGRSVDRAVSLTGTPLASEPYAFGFRSDFSEACQGELKQGLSNLAKVFADQVAAAKADLPVAQGTPAPVLLPGPVTRVNPSVDPETLANLGGGFTVEPVAPEGTEQVAVASSKIRRLGPDYYYSAPQRIEALYAPPDLGPEFSLISSAHAAEPARPSDGPTGPTTVQ
jgi:Protein of unknown function (DUF2865)